MYYELIIRNRFISKTHRDGNSQVNMYLLLYIQAMGSKPMFTSLIIIVNDPLPNYSKLVVSLVNHYIGYQDKLKDFK